MAQSAYSQSSTSAPPRPALPQNVEAEAALLGALMIDNRLAEDIQLKLRPEHFYEPLHGRIYEQILQLLDQNMIATPGDAAAAVRGGRGDEGAGRAGLSRPAHRQRRGDHRRARFRRADLRPRPAPRAGRRRPRDGRAGARHQRGGRSQGPDRGGRGGALPGRRGRRRRRQREELRRGDPAGRPDGREGAQLRRRPVRASPPGSTRSTPRPAASTIQRPAHPRRPPGHGQDRARHQHRLQRRPALVQRHGGRDRRRRNRPAPAVAFFSLEMSADQLATRILAEQSRDQLRRRCAWARSASRISATSPAPRPSSRRCRSISTTRRASPSPRCAPARGG